LRRRHGIDAMRHLLSMFDYDNSDHEAMD